MRRVNEKELCKIKKLGRGSSGLATEHPRNPIIRRHLDIDDLSQTQIERRLTSTSTSEGADSHRLIVLAVFHLRTSQPEKRPIEDGGGHRPHKAVKKIFENQKQVNSSVKLSSKIQGAACEG